MFVTGGAGFLGSWIVRELLELGLSVTVLDDLSTGCLTNLPVHPRLRLVRGSVLDPAATRDAAGSCSSGIHLAAVVGMRLAHSAAAHAYEVAVYGIRNLVDHTGDFPLIVVSSSAVYGLTDGVPVGEDLDVGDASALAYDGGKPGYALGKRHLEVLAQEAAERGRALVVLRPFNVAGPRQSERYGMVVPSFVRRALAGSPLEVHDDGMQTRSFCNVRTFARVVVDILRRPDAWRTPPRVLNVGNPVPTRILDLARIVLDETGSRSPITHVAYQDVFPGRTDVRGRIPDTHALEAWLGKPRWSSAREIVRAVVASERAAAA